MVAQDGNKSEYRIFKIETSILKRSRNVKKVF